MQSCHVAWRSGDCPGCCGERSPVGASVLLGRIAIGDWLTILIGLASLVVLFRWKVSNPLLIATAAAVGLIAFPLLHPAWVMVR